MQSAKWEAEAKLDIHQVRHLFSIHDSARRKLLAKYIARTDRYVTIDKSHFNYVQHATNVTVKSRREWNLRILHCDVLILELN